MNAQRREMDSHLGPRIPVGRSTIPRVGASLPTSLHSCYLGTRPGIPLRCHMSRKQSSLACCCLHQCIERAVYKAQVEGASWAPFLPGKAIQMSIRSGLAVVHWQKVWKCSYGSTTQRVFIYIFFFFNHWSIVVLQYYFSFRYIEQH